MEYDTILVTGGAGFVGSALCQRLCENDVNVIIVDNLSTGHLENIPDGAQFIEGDLADDQTYHDIGDQGDIDAVLHTAGQSSGEASFDDPQFDFESHAVATFKLLRWCHSSGIDRFLYASSMSVYGDPEYLPVDEDHPTDPKTYYSAGKLAAESYVNLYNNLGMDTTILRMFSIYGPGQNLDNMKQGMVSIYLSYLLEEDHILVKGPTDRFRDFVYIDDVVDVWLDALTNNETFGETYNLARGQKVEVEDLLATMIEQSEKGDFPIKVTDGTPGDQFGIYGDVSKLEQDLGWSPETSLDTGIRSMITQESTY